MSSTNRSNSRDTHVSDYYLTPVKAINEFFDKYFTIDANFDNLSILDPCAGGSEGTEMSYPLALSKYSYKCDTIDIREDSKALTKGNYLGIDCKGKYDIIITNPPFNIAIEIIEKALSDVRDGGKVVMLLRLNFFGSQQRKPFFDTNMPGYAFIHHKRLSFTLKGQDSIEYMHAVWIKDGKEKQFTKTYLI